MHQTGVIPVTCGKVTPRVHRAASGCVAREVVANGEGRIGASEREDVMRLPPLSTRVRSVIAQAALLIAVALVAGLGWRQRNLTNDLVEARARQRSLNVGDAVPLLDAVTMAGAPVRVGDTRAGERQVPFFIERECQFCQATVPAWRNLVKALRDSGLESVRVLAMAVDSAQSVSEYLAQSSLEIPTVAFPDRRTRRLFRAGLVPQTVVVGDSGIVLYARAGQILNKATIDSNIAVLVPRPMSASAIP